MKERKTRSWTWYLEYSLVNESVCSSKSITHVVGKSVTVDMIIYDNLEGLITQKN